MSKLIFQFLTFALLLFAQAEAHAADPSQCKQGAKGEEAVAACTALIDGGTAKGWDLAAAYLYRAMGYQDLDKLDEAMADLTQANTLRNPYPEGLTARAKLKALLARKAEAGKAAAGDPADCKEGAASEVNVSACTSFIGKGDHQGTELAAAYLYRGMAYADLSKYDQALDDFKKTIALNPQAANGYRGRAWLNWKFEKPDLVLPDVNKSVALEPDKAWPYAFRAQYYFETKDDWKSAISDYEKAMKFEPENQIYQVYLDNAKQQAQKAGQ